MDNADDNIIAMLDWVGIAPLCVVCRPRKCLIPFTFRNVIEVAITITDQLNRILPFPVEHRCSKLDVLPDGITVSRQRPTPLVGSVEMIEPNVLKGSTTGQQNLASTRKPGEIVRLDGPDSQNCVGGK